ncbi:MAG TPA: MFS transporter [Cyanobacteria bacterium UBA8803]|nr:MFS transporter [Cyanobacteria bacterium UBA9273]HBL58375.1 MFS transporter [Cyanobacteria bacterium UBA8803]
MRDAAKSQPTPSAKDKVLPKINLLTMFRLGLFQMGLGIMSLLTLGVINRIMIDELKVLPLIAAGAIAMHQFVSPARVWFGQMSDAKPMLGYHRTGYVWIGAALFTVLSFIALQVVWQLGGSLQASGWSMPTYSWAGLLALIYALYGLALSASSTPFAALLVDISDEDNRSQLIGIVWSMLMVGIVVGAIVSSKLLERPEICGTAILAYDPVHTTKVADVAKLQTTINPVFIIMPAIVFGLCLLATFGVEPKYSRYTSRSIMVEREDKITFSRALQVLTANRQTGLFFSFLLVLTLSLFMQDAVMEPYGGEVFGMCISETTKLNAPFGIGTLLGISSTGFLILPRLGKQKTTKIGCMGAAVCSGLIILAGFTANPGLLKASLLLFGLSAGVLTAAATSLMLDLTAAETAGTFIGAWGLAQAIARGLSTILGGAVLNLGKLVFSEPVLAYGIVFALQALGMIVAIILLRRVNVREFRDNAKAAIATVIQGDLD